MTPLRLTRRHALKVGIGVAGLAAAGLARPARAAEAQLRMAWWGSKARADRTAAANRLYEAAHPAVSIKGETMGWPDYWPKLATRAAGGNAPDLIQMDYGYIVEYARRGLLLPLDDYMPSVLTIADFGAAAIDCGRVDGKLYGVNLGLNSTAFIYDEETLRSIGAEIPAWDWSWDQWGAWSLRVAQASKRDGYWGLQDAGGLAPSLECWLRQQGMAMYTAEGQLGFGAAEAAGWYGFWHGLRQTGAIPPADVQALDKGGATETSMLALGHAAAISTNSNQLVAHQALVPGRLGLTMQPSGGRNAKPGQFMKPSMLWSVAARSEQAEEAVRVASFYVADGKAAKLLGVERGIPASAAMRAAIAPGLEALDRAMLDYVDFIADKVAPLPPSPPKGTGEVGILLRRINEQVGFGQVSPEEAGRQFITEAAAILGRS
jgi:multiple sugar transport system substrate-binding protein